MGVRWVHDSILKLFIKTDFSSVKTGAVIASFVVA
jgi:hypothetical protein